MGALSCTSCFLLSSSTWLTLLWGAAGRGAWATYDTGVQRKPTHYGLKTHTRTHTHTHRWYARLWDNPQTELFMFFTHRSKKKKKNKWGHNENINEWHLIVKVSHLLTGLCFPAGFLSAGFLAASEALFTVKGTPYLQAGLVIFWAGASDVEPREERLAGHQGRQILNHLSEAFSLLAQKCDENNVNTWLGHCLHTVQG